MHTNSNSGEIILETERLIIRELTIQDISALSELVKASPEAADVELRSLEPEEYPEYIEKYIEYQYGFYGYGNWAVCLKNQTFIGLVGIKNGDESEVGELGYSLLPAFWHKGYAFEACSAVLEYALEDIGFKRIEAHIKKSNEASLKLAGKLKNLSIVIE